MFIIIVAVVIISQKSDAGYCASQRDCQCAAALYISSCYGDYGQHLWEDCDKDSGRYAECWNSDTYNTYCVDTKTNPVVVCQPGYSLSKCGSNQGECLNCGDGSYMQCDDGTYVCEEDGCVPDDTDSGHDLITEHAYPVIIPLAIIGGIGIAIICCIVYVSYRRKLKANVVGVSGQPINVVGVIHSVAVIYEDNHDEPNATQNTQENTVSNNDEGNHYEVLNETKKTDEGTI